MDRTDPDVQYLQDVVGQVKGAIFQNIDFDGFEQADALQLFVERVDRVHLLGPRQDVPALLKTADVFAFPSKTETFGNAVLEAMASGLPVLVTDEGGPKDFVVDGETGFVARSDDEFIERHRQLISDEELRRRIGSRARDYAKTQSWDFVFEEQLVGSYRRVIDGQV